MAETSGLLNRRTGDSRTEGSNPSVSATVKFAETRLSQTVAGRMLCGYASEGRQTAARGEIVMAKGQQRSNKEARKPKKAKPKTIAANPSQKGGPRGLENLKNS